MIVLATLTVVARLIPGPRIIDDAYITYRYARNIVEGVGFVYNAGEAVLGTTTPLYTLLLAVLGWIVGNRQAYPLISVLVNALADGANTVLLYSMACRLFKHQLPGVLLGLLWAVAAGSVTFAIGGMETSVYILLMLGAFAAWLWDRTVLASALTALAVLARPDALIWAGPLALAMIIRKWHAQTDRPFVSRLPWLEGGVFAGLVTPWLIYATLVFGSPLPHSVAAKAVAYRLPPTQALVSFLQNYAIPFSEFDTFGSVGAMIGAVVYPLLAMLGGMYLVYADRRLVPLVIFPWVYAALFSVANPLIFRWYQTPPQPIYFLCILAGVWGLAKRAAGLILRRKDGGQDDVATVWSARVLTVAGALWLATSINAWVLHPDHGPDRPAPRMAWFELELLYERAARSLAPLVDDETVIAAGDIGAVGWYSGARILDTLGLVSPQSVEYYPLDPSLYATTGYAVPPDLIFDERPDYIVILETYGRNGLLVDPRLGVYYRLREVIPTDIYDSEGMLIFERR
jgi:hypothetical protein